MRTETEINAKLQELREDRIRILENRLIWKETNTTDKIHALEWVLGVQDNL